MRKTIFEIAFERVVASEGGFQNDPKDRGNWTSGIIGRGELKGTKFGVSAMSYPHLDIESLTIVDVREIYLRDWWDKMNLDKFPKAVAFQIFDASINHGVGQAIKMVQRAVGVLADGILGPKTLEAVRKIDSDDFVLKFLAERIDFFVRVPTFSVYGKGWMARVSENLRRASEDN